MPGPRTTPAARYGRVAWLLAGAALGGGLGTAARAQEVIPAPPAPDSGLQPRLGFDQSSPGFLDQLQNSFAQQGTPPVPAVAAGPSWQVHGLLTVSEQYTDHAGLAAGGAAGGVGTNTGHDFITLFQPAITATGNTERLNMTLNYAPTGSVFARNGDFDQFRQNANGNIQASVVPNWLFVSASGNIAEQAVFGGLGATAQSPLAPNNRDLLAGGSFSPYLSHGFGDLGTGQIGASYSYFATNAPSIINDATADGTAVALRQNYGSTWLGTTREFANFTTGEFSDRLQDRVSAEANQFDGSGELRNATKITITNDASYAVTRLISVLGEIGYEDLKYPQALYQANGGIWAAGLTLTPSADSIITLEYRRRDGISAPYAKVSWQITPALRLYGGYSEGISTFDQDQQNSLLSGNSVTGASANALIAAPLLGASDGVGGNQALNHNRRLDAALAYVLGRNVVTVSFNHDRNNVVGTPFGIPVSLLARAGLQGLTFAQLLQLYTNPFDAYILNSLGITPAVLEQSQRLTSGTSSHYTGSISWHHDLTQSLSSNLSVAYNRASNAFTSITNTGSIQVSAGLNKTLTETISAQFVYAGTFQLNGEDNSQLNGYVNNNSFLVGVTKRF